MEVVFYSTHCPQCRGLEMQLKRKVPNYTECNDIEEMKRVGLTSAPGLSVDGKVMSYAEALKWLKGI